MAQIIQHYHPEFKDLIAVLYNTDIHNTPLSTPLDLAYQQAYMANKKWQDHSFLITHNDIPVMGLIVYLDDNQDHFSACGRPVRYLRNKNANFLVTKSAQKAFRKHIEQKFLNTSTQFLYTDYLNNSQPSILSDILLTQDYKATTKFYQYIDLTLPHDEIWRGVRNSYRSLVNWGLKNIDLKILSASNITIDDLETFRQLHINEAGKETRSHESWLKQYDQILANEGFLVSGYYQDELVTSALFLHTNHYCYYGVSASRRDLFDKPLSHCVLWCAIEHTKNIGCQIFETGDIQYNIHDNIEDDTKLQGISNFKRGFGGSQYVKLDIKKQ